MLRKHLNRLRIVFKSNHRSKFFFIVAGIGMAACNSEPVIHRSYPVPAFSWSQKDSLSWEIPITDSLATYEVFIEVRNDNSYEYRNLALEILEWTPDSTLIRCDTLNLQLTDKNGRWAGDGWGSLYQNSFVYEKQKRFNQTGTYRYAILPAMTDKRLSGIQSIGLKINKTTL